MVRFLQTADDYWSDSLACAIPGDDVRIFPTNYASTQVCGGSSGIAKLDLVDKNNMSAVYGQVYVWKSYSDVLFISFAIDPVVTGNQAYLFQPKQDPTVGVFSNAIKVWDSLVPNTNLTNYADMLTATSDPLTCGTALIQLQQTCNPTNSRYVNNPLTGNTNGGCYCTSSSRPDASLCPTKDLTASANLFLSVKLSLALRNTSSTSCQSSQSATGFVNVGTYSSASDSVQVVLPATCASKSTPPLPPSRGARGTPSSN
jgi:hypothetical protein